MKNSKMKIITTAVFASIIGSCASIQAVENFEIFNKANNEITVSMKIGNNKLQPFRVPAGYAAQKNTPNNQTIYLIIREAGKTLVTFKTILPTDKTKYITFNPSKAPYLYPQTGPYMGLTRKTESGLSLSKNIDQSYITEGSRAQHDTWD